jgi:hypothetical protein
LVSGRGLRLGRHLRLAAAWLPAEPQVEERHDEQVDQGGGHQPAQDHDRHRMFDVMTRDTPGHDQWQQRQAGSQRRHQNRRHALLRPRQDEFAPERLTFDPLEVAREEASARRWKYAFLADAAR